MIRGSGLDYKVKSLAIKWGTGTLEKARACNLLNCALLLSAGSVQGMALFYYPAILVGSYMYHNDLRGLNLYDPEACKAFFAKSSRFGTIVLLAIFLGRHFG